MTLPALLTVEDVMARCGLRDPRAARKVIDAAGGFSSAAGWCCGRTIWTPTSAAARYRRAPAAHDGEPGELLWAEQGRRSCSWTASGEARAPHAVALYERK